MSESKVPEKLKHFIYKYIDSVEILEILLYLYLQPNDWKTVTQIDQELKTQPASIAKRLLALKLHGLVEENQNDIGYFKYIQKSEEINETMTILSQEYKIRRHQIYELIFNQKTHLKKFADAFIVVDKKNKNGDENG